MEVRGERDYDVVVVDDDQDNLDAFRFAFRKSFRLHYAKGGGPALELLDRLDAAVVVSDQRMPGMSGVEFLRAAKARRPDIIGILLTAYADLPVLVEALNSGAVDRYLQKPWDSKELAVVLRQSIRSFATVRENRRLREQLAHYAGYLEREHRDPLDYGELAGESDAMQAVGTRVAEAAESRSPVLLVAEPGSEHEVVARAIHATSQRDGRPFVRVTCAAFPGPALERELFGWRKGAFPEAYGDRAGRTELADGGTLFLDAPTPPSRELQARLLRLVDEGRSERVGSTDAHDVDVRLVLSLPAPVDRAWEPERVLPEFAARLDVIRIELPPLRERRDDVVPLARHFLRKYAQRNARAAVALSAGAEHALLGYDFPGNARELENVIERAAVLARGDVVGPEHLAFPSHGASNPADLPPRALEAGDLFDVHPARGDLPTRLDDLERRELLAALERCGGNKAEVARSLGLQRTTLYYRLKRLGIEA